MAPLPDRMTAIGIKTPGGPEALAPEERPVPQPGSSEILVRVKAAGVNRPDVMQRKGHYPPPPGAPDIPGLEIAGDVVAVGDKASRWKVGDRVCALVAGGGYAEYCVTDESNALSIPKGFSYVEAAALPETFMTVWHNVFERGALKSGETILIHGGSSGIGTTAIMLAKQFGAKVFITAGSAEKCEACRKLGADVAIDYNKEDFVTVVKEATGKRGVDLILAAHDKYYERSTITGGIPHVITNIGNISPSSPGSNHPDCTVEKTLLTTRSTALFTVDGNAITAKIIDETGAELDAFTLQK